MKSLALAVLLLGAGLVGSAAAGPFSMHHSGSPVVATGGFTVPAEWAGVWTSIDTTYMCPNIFQSTSTSTDTLCVGQVLDEYPDGTCTGTSDLNTIDETCTASGEVFTDCQYNIAFHIHGTRSAFDDDRVRDNLLRIAGWQIYHFTDRTSPSEIIETVGSVLQVFARPAVA